MSHDAVREFPTRAEQAPAFRQIIETDWYVVLGGADLTPTAIDAARRWNLPALRRLAGLTPAGRAETRA